MKKYQNQFLRFLSKILSIMKEKTYFGILKFFHTHITQTQLNIKFITFLEDALNIHFYLVCSTSKNPATRSVSMV